MAAMAKVSLENTKISFYLINLSGDELASGVLVAESDRWWLKML